MLRPEFHIDIKSDPIDGDLDASSDRINTSYPIKHNIDSGLEK